MTGSGSTGEPAMEDLTVSAEPREMAFKDAERRAAQHSVMRHAAMARSGENLNMQKTFKKIVSTPALDLNIHNYNPSRTTVISRVMAGEPMPQNLQILPYVAVKAPVNRSSPLITRMKYTQMTLALLAYEHLRADDLKPTSALSLACTVLAVMSTKQPNDYNTNTRAAAWEPQERFIEIMSDEHFGYMNEDPNDMNKEEEDEEHDDGDEAPESEVDNPWENRLEVYRTLDAQLCRELQITPIPEEEMSERMEFLQHNGRNLAYPYYRRMFQFIRSEMKSGKETTYDQSQATASKAIRKMLDYGGEEDVELDEGDDQDFIPHATRTDMAKLSAVCTGWRREILEFVMGTSRQKDPRVSYAFTTMKNQYMPYTDMASYVLVVGVLFAFAPHCAFYPAMSSTVSNYATFYAAAAELSRDNNADDVTNTSLVPLMGYLKHPVAAKVGLDQNRVAVYAAFTAGQEINTSWGQLGLDASKFPKEDSKEREVAIIIAREIIRGYNVSTERAEQGDRAAMAVHSQYAAFERYAADIAAESAATTF